MNFGAFVEILPRTDGMVHISELANEHVATVEDVVKQGEEITVQIIGIDPSGRIALSRRALLEEDADEKDNRPTSGNERSQNNRSDRQRPRRDSNQRPNGEQRSGFRPRPNRS